MQDATPPDNRREFLAMAASAAVGMGALLPVAATTAAAAEPATPVAAAAARWLDSIPGKHRQVADWPEANNGMGLIYTLAFLMSTPVGFGVPASEVGAVLVIRHDTIPIALNDAMWAKYNLGAVFHIDDPKTKAPAVRNPFYLEPGALPFPDAALVNLIARGVKVAACDLAITFRSGMVARKMGLDPVAVKKEWIDSVLPGIEVLPSGVFATHAAQARGCTYVFAG